jgi:CobQ-like glutamine amidotransferase family enzyme
MSLTIVRLYHDLLGTYGDQGNAEILIHRAKSRGINTELIEVTPGMTIPTSGNIYLLGGGEDGPQTASLELMQNDGGLKKAADQGATVFSVCAGFQVIGTSLPGFDGQIIDGLGLVDVTTVVNAAPRSVGELVVEPSRPGLPVLTGFENHQGLTKLGAGVSPLGTVLSGVGNGFDHQEGVWEGNIIGTYMHGPGLARNPELADALIESATGILLSPFEDKWANQFASERRTSLLASKTHK